MADKTQINLERIRACDAEWEESKHPRSENGQFTSGSGATVSKLQSGGKAKASSIKAGEIAKNQERYDKAHKSLASLYLSDLTNALKKGDYEAAREELDSHERNKKYYDRLTAQNNKFKAAKKTLEKARPKIAAMRQLAQAAKPAGSAPAPSVSPEQSAAKFTKIAEEFKKIDPQVAKYAKQAAKIAAKSGEAAALEWAKNKSAEIEADPDLWPVAKGFHQGRLRMLTEQYNRPAENSAPNRTPAPAPAPAPSKKSDVGQKGIDYLRSISHVNSSAEENTGYTARNMIDMINQGKTLKEIRSEMRSNIKKHSPDIDRDLQHLDSIIAKVKRAQQ